MFEESSKDRYETNTSFFTAVYAFAELGGGRGSTGKETSVLSRLIFFDHRHPRAALDRKGNENF